MEAVVKSHLAPRWQYYHKGGRTCIMKTLL